MTKNIQQYIQDNYYYNPVSGDLWVKYKNFSKICGTNNGQGYLKVKIRGKSYYVHRVCWFLYYGEFPENQIDHIDRNRLNNKIVNLRQCSNQQNIFNAGKRSDNSSGFKGVHFHKRVRKWVAQIRINQKAIHIGYYSTPEEASAAYQKKAAELFGEFKSNVV